MKQLEVLSKAERIRLLKRRRIPKDLSLSMACRLLKVARSVVYYRSRGETKENLSLMERIEEAYKEDPTLGYRRMAAKLRRETGKRINPKRVLKLIRKMGLRGDKPCSRDHQNGQCPTGYGVRT